ncbi:hypothetical protein BH09PLA1_BH09PLA1_02510 [soil metagenome]
MLRLGRVSRQSIHMPLSNLEMIASVESVLSTDELRARPSRPPDHEAENRALLALAQHLADSPQTILQKLAEVALEICRAGSAGVSLVSKESGDFYWPAIAGAWKPHIGGGTPRNFGPCGVVLDRNAMQLFTHPERCFPYLLPVTPPIEEALLTPFYIAGKAAGTVWVIAHDAARKFDAEDLRQIESLGRFAAATHQGWMAQDALGEQDQEMRDVNEALLISSVRQHELTEQAREAEAKYRGLFESIDQGFCIIEKVQGGAGEPLDFRYLEANPAFEAQSGGSDVVGKTIRQAFPGVSEEWFLTYDTVLRTGEPVRFERTLVAAGVSGGRELELYAFRVEDETHRRVAVIFKDVTERKAGAKALRQSEIHEREAKQEAEAANRSKDMFLAVLSHELRTPLTPVLLVVAARELDLDLPLSLRDDLKMIKRNVELEVRLIDDLLDLSRITSGKLRLTLEMLDINELVRRVCQMCHSNVREKGIKLRCDLDPNARAVVGDPGRLQQVFWNLLNNATKFTPDGGQIHITTENIGNGGQDGLVRVTVRDTGMGIAPEILPRVFDAFEQGDVRITRRFGGMGLGLAICKALVEQHRGAIRVESGGTGQGSTFIVEIPALSGANAEAEMPAKPQTRGDDGNVDPLHVLVVEDHADTAKVMRKVLIASGHAVETASTGAAALALARAHKFDLVISDLGLPDMTGYELMTQIKRNGLKGIAMSGYGMEDDIRRSEQAGFSHHLVKPVNLAQIHSAIQRVIGTRA